MSIVWTIIIGIVTLIASVFIGILALLRKIAPNNIKEKMQEHEDAANTVQQLHQCLENLEERLDVLETIILNKEQEEEEK